MKDLVKDLAKLAVAADGGGWGVLSTSQQLATALILERMDWLGELGYSISQAIGRIGVEWCMAIPDAEHEYHKITWENGREQRLAERALEEALELKAQAQ